MRVGHDARRSKRKTKKRDEADASPVEEKENPVNYSEKRSIAQSGEASMLPVESEFVIPMALRVK